MNKNNKGFTLIELMVAVGIIAVMTAVLSANFSDARAQSRDKARMTSLKELQLSVELYKAQYGHYPKQACGAEGTQFAGPGPGASGLIECPNYIVGRLAGESFVPDFISALPTDTKVEAEAGKGFYYSSDSAGSSYKIMIKDAVENLTVGSGDEFARCPSIGGGCAGSIPANTYAVYSAGAETW